MKNLVVFFLLAILTTSCKNETNTDNPVTKTENVLEDFEWVLGDWININTETRSFEHWEKSNDGSLVAYSITLRDQDTVFHEQMKMYEENGTLNLYVETVGDNPNPVVFTQKQDATHPFTFENPRNEFPSQIVYTNPEPKKIHAWVAGFIDSVPQKQEFYFVRVEE